MRFVYFSRAVTSLARTVSPSPRPTTRGLSRLVASLPSAPSPTTANAYVPSTFAIALNTASTSPSLSSASTRWANTSVSVSDEKVWPDFTRPSLSSMKLLMMPLWTMASLREQSASGGACSVVGFPRVSSPQIPHIGSAPWNPQLTSALLGRFLVIFDPLDTLHPAPTIVPGSTATAVPQLVSSPTIDPMCGTLKNSSALL